MRSNILNFYQNIQPHHVFPVFGSRDIETIWLTERERQQGRLIRKPLGNILCSSWNHNLVTDNPTHTPYVFLSVTNSTGHTLNHMVVIHSRMAC